MTRPVVYNSAPARIGWVDPKTGAGVTDPGYPIVPVLRDRRRRPTTLDLIQTAAAARVTRLYLTGPPPKASSAWLYEATPGWSPSPRGHYVDLDDPRGSWASQEGATLEPCSVEIRRAAPFFGEDATPEEARHTWHTLEARLRRTFHAPNLPTLLASPTATGQQLLALSLPEAWAGDQLDDDTAALIRSTTAQHRMEVVGACYDGCDLHQPRPTSELDALHYLDGRLMYAALLSELGTAPARRLTADECWNLFAGNPHARARYLVDYTIPAGWAHPGLLLERHPDGEHWHAPDRPGYRGRTWADGSEVWAALSASWPMSFVEGLELTPGRPLDKWRDRLLATLTQPANPNLDEAQAARVDQLLARAVRAVLLTTIGGFHSTGRDVTVIAPAPIDVPDSTAHRMDLDDGRVAYRTRGRLTGTAARHMRPELSAQVWGRAHARLAAAPSGTGFLTLDPQATIGLWGDALYTDRPTGWPDDGHNGRFRSKGTLPGPLPRPHNLTQLLALRSRIEAA